MAKMQKIGDERWRLEHISYKNWCDVARKRGWGGEEGNDGLREYCEPEEAATIKFFGSLALAKSAALKIFKDAPDDSAFGAILIEYQVLTAAHDDRGTSVRGCPPEWDCEKVYEITSDGDMQECRP